VGQTRAAEKERLERIRFLAKSDLFFLIWFVCKPRL